MRVDSESEGLTYTYTYDASGNIKTKKIYTCYIAGGNISESNLIDTITYTYDDPNWKDKLTAYDGETIDYDAIGNPLSYNGKTFTWLGRRLASYNNGSTTTSYTYNSDGIRTSKTVGGTKTEYFLSGSTILAQKTGSTVMPFYYDANGTRIAFKYNGTMYYYVYNLQGDVTHIIDASKNIVDTYQYDAWGRILNLGALSEVGNANPFRYRGYYYDTESGLYYLNSRYYKAEWGRFINADGYVSTGQGITGYNMFAYCGNNPVNRVDPTGRFWKEVGSFFCKAWSKVKTFVNSTFGAEKITTTTIFEAETPVVPLFLPFSITDTVETTQIVSSKGDSTKPVSVYVDKSLPNSIFSSTVGVKINTSKSTLIISLGLDNTGIYTSTISENTTVESGCRLNLSKLRFGYQHSVAIQYDSSIDTTYTNYSLNGWSLLYAYCYVMTGQQMPQSQYAYSY